MTLLDDVIDAASGDGSVSTLLRQMKVLAARTSTPVLADWVSGELQGYVGIDQDQLPSYRGPFPMIVLAHFVGPFGRQVKNQQLHPMMFPEKLRDGTLFNLWLRESVAELEHLAERSEVTMTWPNDAEVLFAHLHRRGELNIDLQGMQLAQVRCHVASHVYVGVLDAVRNKVLDLALTLEREAPAAGTSHASSDESARAATVINNHFHGTASLAINGNATQIVVELPDRGDRNGLLRYLAAAGVAAEHLVDLERALDEDAADEAGERSPKHARVRAWFAKQSGAVGTGVAVGLLTEAAKAFLGA